jgi:hypothetical protein
LEADVLFRIFVFIPCQTYKLFYGFNIETLHGIWAVGAIETPIKAALSTAIAAIIGPPVFIAIRELGLNISEN